MAFDPWDDYFTDEDVNPRHHRSSDGWVDLWVVAAILLGLFLSGYL
jgi:hypothetical protein